MLSSIPDSQDFKRWKENETPQHSVYDQNIREQELLDKAIKKTHIVAMRGSVDNILDENEEQVFAKLPDIPDRQTQQGFNKKLTKKEQMAQDSRYMHNLQKNEQKKYSMAYINYNQQQ